jgi:hypothetical protein
MTVNFFVGALFAGIGVYFLVQALAALYEARRSRHWPSTSGRVVESQVQKVRGVDGPGYRAEISYVYTVAGHEYVGNRAAFANFMHSSWSGRAARVVRRFPKGACIAVFHDPDEPQESVLVTGFNRDVIGVSVLALALIVLGTWAMAAA